MLFNHIFFHFCMAATLVTALPKPFSLLEAHAPHLGELQRRCVDPPPPQITAVLQVVDADIKTSTSHVQMVTNPVTGQQLVRVLQDFTAMDTDLKKAADNFTATAASFVNATRAQAVINYLTNPLEPDLKLYLNALIAKKTSFTNARSLIQQSLHYLQGNFTLMDNAILAKIPATPTTLKPSASAIISKINADLASATAAFAQ